MCTSVRHVRALRALGRHLLALTAVFAILGLAISPVAAARTTPFSFDYVSTGEEDTSCGFLVIRDDIGKGTGRASDTRFDLMNAGEATLSNPDNGLFVIQKYQVLYKNTNFVTNPDGTESSDGTSVGSSTLYDMDGNVLLRNHGPITTHMVIDPSLPWPDSIISQTVTFEHGEHDGYCATLTDQLLP